MKARTSRTARRLPDLLFYACEKNSSETPAGVSELPIKIFFPLLMRKATRSAFQIVPPCPYSTASEMSLPINSTSTTSIMGRMKRAPFFSAKCDPSRLPRMLLMAQGMATWNTTRPFTR